MSDTPPPELVERLARILYDEGWWCGDCDYESGPCGECQRMLDRTAAVMLLALAEWADGGLIDPSTWTVVEVREVGGIEWCDDHQGIVDECSSHEGCDLADGEDCHPTALFTLTPVPPEETP